MKKMLLLSCSLGLISLFALTFASQDKADKKVEVEVTAEPTIELEDNDHNLFKLESRDKPLTLVVTTKITKGDSIETQVREINLNIDENEIDLEKILKDLNLDLGDSEGETKCIVKISGDADELEDLELNLDDLDQGGNVMVIELDDEDESGPMAPKCCIKGQDRPDRDSYRHRRKKHQGHGFHKFFKNDDDDENEFPFKELQGDGSSHREFNWNDEDGKEMFFKMHDDDDSDEESFLWHGEDDDSGEHAFQYKFDGPSGPHSPLRETGPACDGGRCDDDRCQTPDQCRMNNRHRDRAFKKGPQGGFGIDFNVLDFDFSGINSFITGFGFAPINNNGATFVGFRGQKAIGPGWFLGALGAGYATTQNIKDAEYSRHLSIQSGYGGVTLTRRYPIRPFLLFEGSVMLGGGNTDIEISEVRQNPSFDNPLNNFANVDHLKFEKLYVVYRPEASLIMRINPILGIRGAVSYMGSYSGEWKTVPFGYAVEGNAPNVPDGMNYSLGLWIGR